MSSHGADPNHKSGTTATDSDRASKSPRPGDEAPAGTPGTGEDVCRVCGGTGKVKSARCGNCNGTGRVIEGIGGG